MIEVRSHTAAFSALALSFLVHAAAFAQTSATEYNNAGVEHYTAQRFTDAIVSFRSAYKLAPDNTTVRNNLANALQAQAGDLAKGNDYDKAITHLEEAVRLEPENPEPLTQMGAYHLMEGDIKKAIFRLEEAIEIAPGHVDAHFLLGEAYFKDHDVASALDQWHWVEQIEPDMPGLKERMDTALKDQQIEHYFRVTTTANFHIRYSAQVRGTTLRAAISVLEESYRDIGREMGGVYPPGPIAVTLYTAATFTEATQMGGHVGALYDGSRIRCPVVDEHGKAFPEEEIRRRLIHEYVHVLVRHAARDAVPWWFNEGLAETYSRRQADGERAYLKRIWEESGGFGLNELGDSQLDKLNVENLKLAYIQSHATVQYLRDQHGYRKLGQMLSSIGSGEEPEAALRQIFRHTYRSLEAAVADSL